MGVQVLRALCGAKDADSTTAEPRLAQRDLIRNPHTATFSYPELSSRFQVP